MIHHHLGWFFNSFSKHQRSKFKDCEIVPSNWKKIRMLHRSKWCFETQMTTFGISIAWFLVEPAVNFPGSVYPMFSFFLVPFTGFGRGWYINWVIFFLWQKSCWAWSSAWLPWCERNCSQVVVSQTWAFLASKAIMKMMYMMFTCFNWVGSPSIM